MEQNPDLNSHFDHCFAQALGEGLASNTTLTTLELGNSAVDDEAAALLAPGLRVNATLRTLCLRSCWLTAEGAGAFAAALASCALTYPTSISHAHAVWNCCLGR